MGLSADLRALGPVLEPPEQQWGDPELPQALLCPRLRTTYSPRASWAAHAAAGPGGAGSERQWARVWAPGPTALGLGLSLVQRSKRGTREGLSGLPANGRKSVWRALALLEEMRPLLSFWTISLPPEAMEQLGASGQLPAFQDRLRQELIRLLQRAGLPALVVGVAELQPKRSQREGRPCPHWHVVFQGRRNRGSSWALKPEQLDGVILSALATAGVSVSDLQTAGNVQQVKRSVRAYLSKYMTKGSGDVAPWRGDASHENLIPHRWWFWSRPLRAWVIEHIFPIAFSFLAWVHEHREQLGARALARFRQLELSDPAAPITWEVNWLSCDRLGALIYLWQSDEWEEEWFRQQRLSQCPDGLI